MRFQPVIKSKLLLKSGFCKRPSTMFFNERMDYCDLCCLVYSQRAMAPLTCTLRDLTTPNCGISMQASRICIISTGTPSFSRPRTSTWQYDKKCVSSRNNDWNGIQCWCNITEKHSIWAGGIVSPEISLTAKLGHNPEVRIYNPEHFCNFSYFGECSSSRGSNKRIERFYLS